MLNLDILSFSKELYHLLTNGRYRGICILLLLNHVDEIYHKKDKALDYTQAEKIMCSLRNQTFSNFLVILF
jgi:hypothetical protein